MALDTLRRRKCYPDLWWLATHHTDTDHPHVHVLLLGYQPRRYGERPLVLVRSDASAMEATIAAYCPPMPVSVDRAITQRPVRSWVLTDAEERDHALYRGAEGETDTDGDGP